MSILQMTDLTHGFGDKTLYKGADLALYKGEHMGIVGQNGTGKSTLIKILLGEVVPSDGIIAWQTGIQIGHLDQYAEMDAAQTIDAYLHTAFADLYTMEKNLQDLYAAMNGSTPDNVLARAARMQETLLLRDFYAIDSQIARVAAGLGLTAIGMARTLGTLSGGQRAKVILAKLLLQKPDVLLLDEPTNFLDVEHIAWLTEYLNAFEGSFMIVSHDFAFLDAVTNCICDIEFMTMKKYHGSYAAYVRQKAHLREEYVRQYDAQQREVKKLETYIAKNRTRASTARLARSRQKKLDKMDILAPTTVLEKPRITFASLPLADAHALEVDALKVGYGTPLLPPLRFTVAGGEKVVVTGFNGIGKSTLLKTLVGEIPALGGEYAFAQAARIGYFAQDLAWEDSGQTPLAIIGAAYPALLPRDVRRALSRYGVRAEHVMRPIGTLSGGEQNKVKLCKMALTPQNFLILDEPTNHLDAETKASLQEAIVAFEGTVLLVCHEAEFYRDFADRVINIEAFLG